VHGDANGETLKIQWRDAAGRYSDWVMPVDYRGWRLQQSRLEATPEFDWHQVEYVIVYYNNLPKATCEVRLDGLRALPPAGKPPVLRRLSFTLNGRRLSLPALGPGEALVLDGNGRARRCVSGQPQGRATAVAGGALELQPGLNQLELACGDKGGSVARVQARVIPLAP
jgi:hypothetical protein